MGNFISQFAYVPPATPRGERPTEHRCAQCYHKGFGKSPIPCPNEPRRTDD